MKAKLKLTRMSPRKLRLIADMIRGKDVNRALSTLRLTEKKGAKIIEKVLRSAMANAENKHSVDLDKAYIQTLLIDQGPILKRWMARAQGRASPILKRTSKISLTLGVR